MTSPEDAFCESTPFEYEDILQVDESADEQIAEILADFVPTAEEPRPTFTSDADSAQSRFISSDARTIRLLAPAGSGKTQSIANRVARCCADGLPTSRLLLLTFDNAARVTLAGRVDARLRAVAIANSPQVLTLNSFGNGLLRNELVEHVPVLSLGEGLEKYQSTIVRAAIKEARQGRPSLEQLLPRNLAAVVYCQLFSVLKNEIITPNSFSTKDGVQAYVQLVRRSTAFRPWLDPLRGVPDAKEKAKEALNTIAMLYRSYWNRMRNDQRMDYDDQKLIPFLTLRGNPQLSEWIQSKFAAIVVDEFQDINRLDFEFITLVASKASLVVVGDDDQAIYGFRGCSPNFIINFESLSGRLTETFSLDTNYRSPVNVVQLSQRLIANNQVRVVKRSNATEGAPVADIELWHAVNSASEAQIIAKSVKRVVGSSKGAVQYGDIAVLFRINSQSLPLQLALIVNEIPYHCRREDNVLLSDTMERIVRLVGVHVSLRSGATFTSVEDAEALYESYFKWHKQENRRQFASLASKRQDFVGAAVEIENRDSRWRGFASAIASLKVDRSPVGVIEYIGETFKNLRGLIGNLEQAVEGHVPLGELLDVARRFKGDTQDFHETLQDLTRKAQQGLFSTGEEDGVNLLTYFRAKGRQWHTVFLPGVNQRVIPDHRAPIEDERRLFYVAVTRPTANLVFSYVRQAVRERVTPSQFLVEMGLGEGKERRATS